MIDLTIDGHKYGEIEEKMVVSTVLSTVVDRFDIMSPDAIRQYLISLAEMVLELGGLSGGLVRKFKMLKLAAERTQDKNLIFLATNCLLAEEGLNDLPNFGFKGHPFGNPERGW